MTATFITAPQQDAGEKLDWNQHQGHLAVIKPQSFDPQQPTTYGERACVWADIIFLHDDGTTETYENTPIFPTVLVRQTKNYIGQMVLGRITTGQPKPGQRPPWMIDPTVTPADMNRAQTWAANNPTPTTQATPPPTKLVQHPNQQPTSQPSTTPSTQQPVYQQPAIEEQPPF